MPFIVIQSNSTGIKTMKFLKLSYTFLNRGYRCVFNKMNSSHSLAQDLVKDDAESPNVNSDCEICEIFIRAAKHLDVIANMLSILQYWHIFRASL